ncbi:gamma-glutamylcyclotransferase family protein [Magnetospirillum sp. UT-4]|uniref:gamma-glutamylcyclotransferase family protein n=1 Tax=Magnetospirillum sp. UT-4 TaxID=2681467 RepID=UPI0013805C5F|nr:gamma-glutamylcyclotransferase family protein [Magnetospirillum sp. UT-4]CAA7613222.1 putative avirulence induced gene (AIG) protein [Magnetospirillum sp. UT-4]
MDLFFFGTLLDEDLCTLVCGRRLDDPRPAVARGWRRLPIAGRTYPMLVPYPPGAVEGLLAPGLDDRVVARLVHYEGPEYDLLPIALTLADGTKATAHAFLCRPGVVAAPGVWRLEEWRRRHKPASLARIARWMAGHKSPRPPAGEGASVSEPG